MVHLGCEGSLTSRVKDSTKVKSPPFNPDRGAGGDNGTLMRYPADPALSMGAFGAKHALTEATPGRSALPRSLSDIPCTLENNYEVS